MRLFGAVVLFSCCILTFMGSLHDWAYARNTRAAAWWGVVCLLFVAALLGYLGAAP